MHYEVSKHAEENSAQSNRYLALPSVGSLIQALTCVCVLEVLK